MQARRIMQAPFGDSLLGFEQRKTAQPLVGRDVELQLIHTLLNTVSQNLPDGARALIISGEMGVGKSRLLAAMCQAAQAQGFRVLESCAYESGSMFPYFPFIEALRPLLRSATPEQLYRYLGLSSFADKEESATSALETASTYGLPAAIS